MDDQQRRRRRSKDTKVAETQVAGMWAGGRKTLASGSRPISDVQRVMANSGAFGDTKVETKTADVESTHYVIDHKRSETGSYTLSQTACSRLRRAAKRANKDPAIHFTFMPSVEDHARFLDINQEHWVAIPKELFDKMDAHYRAALDIGDLGEDT